MKFKPIPRKWLAVSLVLPLLAVLAVSAVLRQPQQNKESLLQELVSMYLDQGHYQPRAVDNTLSKDVFQTHLEYLDYSKRFFTAQDMLLLRKHELQLDEQIRARTFEFFDLSLEIFNRRLGQVEEFYPQILAQPFDFSAKEEIETDPEKLEYPKDDQELREFWRKMLKLQTLERVHTALSQQEKAIAQGKADSTRTFEQIEQEARGKVLETYQRWFENMDQVDREDHFGAYMNSIANAFDPHTEFFPPQDRENFNISMSGRLEGIGATLQADGDYTKVHELVPGSPSWKQGDLEAGDLIIKVAQGQQPPVDVVGMRLDDVVQLIRGEKGTEVRLTVKKIDGSVIEVPIVRDVIEIEATYAKSAVVELDGQRFGYIHLPKFYMDFDDPDGRSCSEDVAEEIRKLKAQDVEGIVLDLRNNGGGSLGNVVDMAGLFIEKGPVTQVRARDNRSQTLADTDPSILWDGPLLVMVNSFSASASEILAAAVQDYNRGLIMGSPSTFGKGTVQQFFELDAAVPMTMAAMKPFGSIKITTQKFYRVNGATTQLRGVVPDIIVPDQYSKIPVGEREVPFALQWDEITPTRFSPLRMDEIRRKVLPLSQSRIRQSEFFQLMEQNADRVLAEQDNTRYPLQLDEYRAQRRAAEQAAERFKALDDMRNSLIINALPEKTTLAGIDSAQEARQKIFTDKLLKDMYLDEAVRVLNDMAHP